MGKMYLPHSALVQAASTIEGVEMLGLGRVLLCCKCRKRERLYGVEGTMAIAHFVVCGVSYLFGLPLSTQCVR